MTQVAIPFGTAKHPFKKGVSVIPKKGRLVPSQVMYGWERGMIYDVGDEGEIGIPLTIKGIHDGCEFSLLEFTDNVELRP